MNDTVITAGEEEAEKLRKSLKKGPLDLDGVALAEAEADAQIRGWARIKRIFTFATKRDMEVYGRFLQYVKPHLGKVILGTILSILGGSLMLGQLLLIERGLSVLGGGPIAGGSEGGAASETKIGKMKGLASSALGGGSGERAQPGDAGAGKETEAAETESTETTPSKPVAEASTKVALAAPGSHTLDPAMDRVVGPIVTKSERLSRLKSVCLLFLVVILAGAGLNFLQSMIMAVVGRQVIRAIREDCFKNLVQLPLRFHQGTHSSQILTRITKDITRLRTLLISMSQGIPKEAFVFLAALGYALTRTSWAAIFALGFVILAIVPIRIIADKLKHRDRAAEAGAADLYAIVSEALAGQKVVKAFTAERYEIRRFNEATRGLYEKQMVTYRLRAMTEPLIDIVAGLGIAAGIWVLGSLVIDGGLDLAVLATTLLALQKLAGSVRKIGKYQNDFIKGIAAAERVDTLLTAKRERRNAKNATPLENFSQGIEYRNVTFGYNDEPVLRNINLWVGKGQTIALVGPSGAGKTSLVDLLPRLYDTDEGEIFVDGVEIKQYTLKSLRHQIGIVGQETMLFRDSVRENIAYGLKEFSDDAVIAAAKAASAHEFIMGKVDGYDTPLGERGSHLSGGERQRIAIARALLKNPPILILDEATSALDVESEHAVQEALAHLMQGRTTLVIAHRLSTIHAADRIVVLNKGSIVEEGSHDELMAAGGRYAKAYRMQMDATLRGDNAKIDDFFEVEE